MAAENPILKSMRPDCHRCSQPIEDYSLAGRLGKQWLHKDCWLAMWREERVRGVDLPVLTSPLAAPPREMSVMVFALMFHFGIALAMIAWVFITQEDDTGTGLAFLVPGVLIPMAGVLGLALSVYRRRNFEVMLHDLGRPGVWSAVPNPERSRD
ncbi:MAG: hypothetical protein GEU28_03930 [Dehalococcoidia bacterium]|nr:hypothetical protein [Dehalococcoidia bacterium]